MDINVTKSRISTRGKMENAKDFCNAFGRLCCELFCWQVWYEVGRLVTYLRGERHKINERELELQAISSGNNGLALDLESNIELQQPSAEPRMQGSCTSLIAGDEPQQSRIMKSPPRAHLRFSGMDLDPSQLYEDEPPKRCIMQ
jgi:hypothetical protein